jgi:hypothetical protein
MARGRGRPKGPGRRTGSGQLSRAGRVPKIDRGADGTRFAHARALLEPADAQRLVQLMTRTPEALAADTEFALDRGTAKKPLSPADAVELERAELFRKAEAAPNAHHRKDPVGRAWHAGLLDGRGADPAAMRDLGREYGFLYWRELRSLDVKIGGYAEMLGRGSVHLAGDVSAADRRWKRLSDMIQPLGPPVRTALHRLCVDDIWFLEGPDWLTRLINARRVANGLPIVGELPRRGDARLIELALAGLAALAIGSRAQATRPSATAAIEQQEVTEAAPPAAIDPAFLDENGLMRPWEEVCDIIRSRIPAE